MKNDDSGHNDQGEISLSFKRLIALINDFFLCKNLFHQKSFIVRVLLAPASRVSYAISYIRYILENTSKQCNLHPGLLSVSYTYCICMIQKLKTSYTSS